MKFDRHSIFLPVSAQLMALALAAGSAQGAIRYWDGGNSNIGTNGDGISAGGAGTWNLSIQNWDQGNALAHVGWNNAANDEAVFGGTAGTVTIGSGVTVNANKLTFSTGNYTIAGTDSTSVLNFTGTTPTIAGSGKTYFTSKITGSAGLTISSGGFNVFTGDLSGLSGTVNVDARATLQGVVWGGGVGNGAGVLSGSQFQTWNVTNVLTSNNKGTGSTIQLGALSGTGTVRAGNDGDGSALAGTDTFQVGNLGTNTTFSGTIQDFAGAAAALTKVGSGTLTLTASNSYSGTTTVNGGTLVFSGSGSVYNNGANTGSIIVNNGGTLKIDRQDLFGGHTSVPTATITVNNGGLLTGNANYNTLNNLTLNGGTLQTANGDAFWGSFALKGTVTAGGSSASIISSGGSTNNYIRIGNNTAGGVTTFNVADSTGNVNTDLTISAQLRDNKEPGTPFGDVAGGLTKTGVGTLTLSGANTFTGAVTVTNGTLVVGTAGADNGSTGALGLGTGGKTITVSSGATLAGTAQNWFGNHLNVGTLPTIVVTGGTLSTSRYTTIGALTLNGATMTNTATDTGNYQAFAFRGNVTVGGSSVSTISANAATATTQGYHLGSNTTFTVADATSNANTDLLISAPLRNQSADFANAAGALTKSGAGTLTLTGANTYSGGTTINAGAISVGDPGSSGANGTNTSLGGGSVNVVSGAQLIFAGQNLNIANNVTLNGTATVNSLQGALVGGRQDGSTNNTLSGILTLAGTGDRTISTWWSDKTLTLSGKVTGTGNLRVINANGGGNGGSIVILSNNTNDYSGDTIVDSGGSGSTQTLRLGASNVISDGAGKGNVFINGRLELNTFTETINGLNGSGTVSTGSGSALTVGNNHADGTFSGVIDGFASLTKTGSGTQTLTGGNSYVGGTTISGGTLRIGNGAASGALSTSGTITNNGSLVFNRTDTVTQGTNFSTAAISGSGSLTQAGSGVLVLNASNTYAGNTTVTNGTLRFGANNVLADGAGKGNVIVDGRLELNNFSDTINGLSGSGEVDMGGTSAVLTAGNNDASGSFSGRIVGNSGSTSYNLRKIGTGTLTLSGTGDNTNARARVDAGTLVLAKTNSASAHALGSTGNADYALVITGGLVQLGGTADDQIWQNSAINMTGGTFDLAGKNEGFDGLSGTAGTVTNSTSSTTSTLTLGQNNSAGTQVFSGIIQNGNGSVALTKTGSGTQVLAGANTYGGQTAVDAGTLRVDATPGSTGGTVFVGNGATTTTAASFLLGNASGGVSHASAINVNPGNGSNRTIGGTNTSGTNTFTGLVQLEGSFGQDRSVNVTAANGGTVVFSNAISGAGQNITKTDSGKVVFSGTNTYTGTTTITAGSLQLGNGGVTGSLSTSSTISNNGTLIVNRNNAVSQGTDFSGAAITGSGAFTQAGSGTTTLTATNSYTGATTVNSGTLVVNGSISTSITTVNSGGTLGGSGTVGALTVKSGGNLFPGNSPGILDVGNTELEAGSTLGIEIAGATIGAEESEYDQLRVTGSASLAGLLAVTTSYTPMNGALFFILANDADDAITGAGFAGTGTFSNATDTTGTAIYTFGGTQEYLISYVGNYTGGGAGTFTGGNDVVLMAVPEPSATALLGGLGTLALLRRRRHRSE